MQLGAALLQLLGHLSVTESNMNSSLCQLVRAENASPRIQKEEPDNNNDFKHFSKSIEAQKAEIESLWNGPIKEQILIPLRSCGVIQRCLKTPFKHHRPKEFGGEITVWQSMSETPGNSWEMSH